MPAVRTVIVSAAIVIEGGRVLVTQRKPGAHLAGAWEFPGGKVEPGEDPKAALERELNEELGIEARTLDILDVTFHAYEDRSVLLLFYEAERRPGSPEPRALDVAALRWLTSAELVPDEFPPADVAVLKKVHALLKTKSTS